MTLKVGDNVKDTCFSSLGVGVIVAIIQPADDFVVYWDSERTARTCSRELLQLVPSPFDDVKAELERASKHGHFASAHEGFAVLLEEVDELKAHVWTKQKDRDLVEMRKEVIQVAAMAVKFAQMIDEGRGQ